MLETQRLSRYWQRTSDFYLNSLFKDIMSRKLKQQLNLNGQLALLERINDSKRGETHIYDWQHKIRPQFMTVLRNLPL